MNDYIESRFDLEPCPGEDATDLLAALLADIGYESFVPDDKGVTAYIRVEDYDSSAIAPALADFPFDCIISRHDVTIEGRDWNAEWERNYFRPIVVGDKCVVHSTFHTDVPTALYDIVIDPKMAFGTGHHATTALMLTRLLEADLQGRAVIDMGTGTGILAILAAMRGAAPVTAIEIDAFAYDNAVENCRLNHHAEIRLIHGDATALDDADIAPADFFIANINRNVITADIARYAAKLKSGGAMLLSGFYEADVPIITEAAEPHGLAAADIMVKDNWTCLKLIKQ
ncbi:MAG: 50S ribosomal protein L11 methyltransferase [Muribaculaceae bacterium]